ncbi:MAG TPA: nuclear transport factor 2 family protein [Acidimicrobiales bacterium]|jgi:hypothetical protein
MESSEQIRNLLATYCGRIDRGEFAGVGDLFGKGGQAYEHGNLLATGPEAVADVLARQVIRYDEGTPSTKHVVVNTVFVDLAGELSLHLRPEFIP